MKSLKELIADKIALTEQTLDVGEAEFILTVLKSIQEDTSKYEVWDDKLRHTTKVTNGLVTREYINGYLVKELELYPDGNVKAEAWFNRKGKLDRKDFPAQTIWFPNGNKLLEGWFKNGKFYRENNLPSYIQWNENGDIITEL